MSASRAQGSDPRLPSGSRGHGQGPAGPHVGPRMATPVFFPVLFFLLASLCFRSVPVAPEFQAWGCQVRGPRTSRAPTRGHTPGRDTGCDDNVGVGGSHPHELGPDVASRL